MRKKEYTLQDLMQVLKRTVIGQDDYLKKIAVMVWLHAKRMEASKRSGNYKLQKHNLLCVGPSGSGKTLAINKLANLYGFDVLVTDASGYTGAGWRGKDAEDIIKDLYYRCEKDTERAKFAIVVLDEVDKMLMQAQGGRSTEPSFCAENTFLKILEGAWVDVGDCKISTDNVLFIAAGAFEGIETIVKRRMNTGKLGFHADRDDYVTEHTDLLANVTRADLQEYGVGIQFLGRFADLAVLRNLDERDLTSILLDSDASIVRSLDFTLRKSLGIAVTMDVDGAEALAEQAIAEGTGARGLAQIILPMLNDILFCVDENSTINEISLTVNEKGKPCVKLQEGMRQKRFSDKQKVQAVLFPSANQYEVEHFGWKLLTSFLDANPQPFSKAQAMHHLLCSIVFYILLATNKKEHVVESIEKLIHNEPNGVYQVLLEKEDDKLVRHARYYYELYKKSSDSVTMLSEAIEMYVQAS